MTKWELKGDYFEACNCDIACPCIFGSDPTGDDCTVFLAWHVDKGTFGDIKLDGLNAAIAVCSPGPMGKVKWKAATYIDSKATNAQSDALSWIFNGKEGGPPAGWAPAIGEDFGTKKVPMSYEVEGKRHSVVIPRVIRLEVESIAGKDGSGTIIKNPPGGVAPSVHIAKSKKFTYTDHGMNWKVSDKNSFHSHFSWKGSSKN